MKSLRITSIAVVGFLTMTAPPVVQGAAGGQQLMIEARFFEVPSAVLNLIPGAGPLRNPRAIQTDSTSQVVTAEQSKRLLQALEHRADVTLLARQAITTLNDRQAQILLQDQHQTKQAGRNSPPPQMSYSLWLTPHVGEDGFTVWMTLVPGFKHFLGFDMEPKSYTDASGGMPRTGRIEALTQSSEAARRSGHADISSQQLSAPISQFNPPPVYSEKKFTTQAVLWDQQTVIISLPRGNKSSGKALLVFVTPTLVSPAGRSLHQPEEMPFARSAIPPQ